MMTTEDYEQRTEWWEVRRKEVVLENGIQMCDDITDTDQKPRTAEQRKKIHEWWEGVKKTRCLIEVSPRCLIEVSQTTFGPRPEIK